MTTSPIPATVSSTGITFTVQVDYIKRECFISNEALQKLADRKGFDGTPEAAFRAMERGARILPRIPDGRPARRVDQVGRACGAAREGAHAVVRRAGAL